MRPLPELNLEVKGFVMLVLSATKTSASVLVFTWSSSRIAKYAEVDEVGELFDELLPFPFPFFRPDFWHAAPPAQWPY